MRAFAGCNHQAFRAAIIGGVAGVALGAGHAWATEAEAPTEVEKLVVTARSDNDDYDARRSGTATKTDTPLQDVPQSVSVVTSELIEDMAMQSMADVVRYTPGVTMAQGEGHRDAPTIRGNSTTADFFVDGVRDDVQYFRDVYNAERVEVLKGPNAMIFGRGGGGGVINRVTKSADSEVVRELGVELGSYDHRRFTADVNQPLGDTFAVRFNGLYQDSGSFRDEVEMERWGVNPTLTWRPAENLTARLSYEHFSDERTVDRGIPTLGGRVADVDISTFFGNPDESYAYAYVDTLSATVNYGLSDSLTLRNRTVYSEYEKFYQNVFPSGAVTGANLVPIQGYSNLTLRENLFSQTDLIWEGATGSIGHTVLLGAELGRQTSTNFRETGFFNNTTATFNAPLVSPTISAPPITFRQSASDADNHGVVEVAGVYLQDQIALTDQLQVIAGIRYDSFEFNYRNNRNGDRFKRKDELVSPRLGLVFKPAETLSIYASYSVSYLPSSGDQFSSLTLTNQAFDPEEFTNYEVGAKWEVRPDLLLTLAVYQLERDNTTAPDPVTPGVVVLTGSQRTMGFELGLTGQITDRWQLAGGFSRQDAEITSGTLSAPAGQKIALTPEFTFSLWNKYQITPRFAAGLGVIYQGDAFAAIDNTVVLPSFTRVDGALYYDINDDLRLQLNVENLFDERYYPTSHGNNNILPGAPRSLRIALKAQF